MEPLYIVYIHVAVRTLWASIFRLMFERLGEDMADVYKIIVFERLECMPSNSPLKVQ